jgi:hypothetical protein
MRLRMRAIVHIGCSPPVLVREHLTAAKQSGQPFDDAWAAASASLARTARLELSSTLQATRGAWERAYGDVPATKAETAMAFLARTGDDYLWRDLASLLHVGYKRKKAA